MFNWWHSLALLDSNRSSNVKSMANASITAMKGKQFHELFIPFSLLPWFNVRQTARIDIYMHFCLSVCLSVCGSFCLSCEEKKKKKMNVKSKRGLGDCYRGSFRCLLCRFQVVITPVSGGRHYDSPPVAVGGGKNGQKSGKNFTHSD